MSAAAQIPSLSRRRPSGASLAPLVIPPLDSSEPVRPVAVDAIVENDEVVEEGKELFKNFFCEQLEREQTSVGLQELQVTSSPPKYKNPLWAKAGTDLRQLADEFARTKKRGRVRAQAEAIGEDVTRERFHDLLQELFAGEGVTQERIVVLFYFCSDVAINALRVGRNLFQQFWEWSMGFIIEYVCIWVQRNGGWAKVLGSPFNSYYKVTIWLSVVAGAFVMYKYFRSRSI